VRGGGLAGLVSTTAIDTAALPATEADRLRSLVQRAELSAPGAPAEQAPAPDAELYQVIVEDHGKRSTYTLSEAHLSGEARELINWIDTSPHHTESLEPPG